MTYPRIGVVPHEKVAGAYSLSDVKSVMEVLPLDVVLQRQWSTPALFTTYSIDGEAKWPRINKRGGLVKELAEHHGSIVKTVAFAFDFDRPKAGTRKVPWESQAEVNAVLAKLKGTPPPTALYVTRHGLRLVYVLEEPIDPYEGEGYYAAMLADFAERGIGFDPSCQNWDRLFRVPFFVPEGGTPSWELPVVAGGLKIRPRARLSLEGITPIDLTREESHHGGVVRGERPDEADALALVTFVSNDGKVGYTAFGKDAKKRLRGRDYYEALFDGARLPCPEGRDIGIHKAVSSIVGLMVEVPRMTPHHVYGLLYEPVAALEPDAEDPSKDWLAVLWDKIERTWALEKGKLTATAAVAVRQSDRIVDSYREMLAKQGVDIDAQSLEQKYPTTMDWIVRHSIATDGRYHYILTDDGTFSARPSTHPTLLADIHTSGMDRFYPMMGMTATGVPRPNTPQQLIDMCGVTYHRMEGVIGMRHTVLRFREGGERVLEVPLYRLNDELLAQAEPSHDVDDWLRLCFGARYARVCEWIGHALDLHRGICALSIVGPPQTGKTLFAEILSRCLQVPHKNDFRVFGKFNAGLRNSPIVHIDEGIDAIVGGGQSVDETFRVFTTGGQITLEQKYAQPVPAHIYPRLILTANSANILEAIAGNRDLSQDSRDALEERVMMTVAQEEARVFFMDRSSEWVERTFLGTNQAGARHFLWLYQNRRPPTGRRLLVEGERGTQMFEELSYASPKAQIVVRALIEMLQSRLPWGVQISDKGVFVSASAIESYVENAFMGVKITARAVGKVFAETDLASGPANRTGGIKTWKLNLETLLRVASDLGKDTSRIVDRVEQAVASQEAVAIQERDVPATPRVTITPDMLQ